MSFLGVVVFCASLDFTTCQITSKAELFDTIEACQADVVMVVNGATSQGFIARGYCAPVNSGMQTQRELIQVIECYNYLRYCISGGNYATISKD